MRALLAKNISYNVYAISFNLDQFIIVIAITISLKFIEIILAIPRWNESENVDHHHTYVVVDFFVGILVLLGEDESGGENQFN